MFAQSLFHSKGKAFLLAYLALVAGSSPARAQSSPYFTFSQTSRLVTAEEIADGAPAGMIVYEFFVTSTTDITRISGRVDVPVYQHNLGSEVEPPDPSLVLSMPALGVDTFVTTPGVTRIESGSGLQSGASWIDDSDDGPQTNFRFAQITTAGIGTFNVGFRNPGSPNSTSMAFLLGNRIDLDLVLRYNNPVDLTEGGAWRLLAKTNNPAGMASVRVRLNDVDASSIVIPTDIGSVDPVDLGEGSKPRISPDGAVTEILYGQDLSGSVRTRVGFSTSIAFDGALLASGNFGDVRPSFAADASEIRLGSVLNGLTAPFASIPVDLVTTAVRGDSVALDGLLLGDFSRDGIVNSGDLGLVLTNYNRPGRKWDWGDGNDDGVTNTQDLNLVLSNWNKRQAGSAAALAIPEPSLVLFCAGWCAVIALQGNRRTTRIHDKMHRSERWATKAGLKKQRLSTSRP